MDTLCYIRVKLTEDYIKSGQMFYSYITDPELIDEF